MKSTARLAIIGGGAMGTAFASGVISAGLFDPGEVVVADVDGVKLEKVATDLGVWTDSDNVDAIRGARVVMLAVKPAKIRDVLSGIAGALTKDQLVVSIAAGVKLEAIESALPSKIGVVRAMPNTPCLVNAGAIGFSLGKSVTSEQAADAKQIFDAAGISFEVPEKLLDAVTGLSGSGPAYVFVFIEALSDAGVRVGLPREIATKLAAQTAMGAAQMVLDTGEHPARLKDQVTTPGGTTVAGLDALEKAGFRSALIEAVKAATKRSEELG